VTKQDSKNVIMKNLDIFARVGSFRENGIGVDVASKMIIIQVSDLEYSLKYPEC